MIGVLVALSQIGINLGPLLAGMGIVGFVVGFALQDTLSNFAAGVMILIYQPFDEGDVVEDVEVAVEVEEAEEAEDAVGDFVMRVLHQK